MGWVKRGYSFSRYSDPDYRAYLLRQEIAQEKGTRYRRKPEHQKKSPSDSDLQKREWKKRKSQYRDQMRNWTSYKYNVKHYCARYYRAWVRSAINREDWDAFVNDAREFKYQENPWSWD